MADITEIHQDKEPFRKHFIREWMEYRQLKPADLIQELGVDKSQVYRWLRGQLPHEETLKRIAGLFELEKPEQLLRDPYDDWFAKFFRDRSSDEKKKIKEAIESLITLRAVN